MDESKFNSAFETTLHELKLNQQAEAEEAERQRLANEPAERERADATSWLRQELFDLGNAFVAKANELGFPPLKITELWDQDPQVLGYEETIFETWTTYTKIQILEDGSILHKVKFSEDDDTRYICRKNMPNQTGGFVVDNREAAQQELDNFTRLLAGSLARLVIKPVNT